MIYLQNHHWRYGKDEELHPEICMDVITYPGDKFNAGIPQLYMLIYENCR